MPPARIALWVTSLGGIAVLVRTLLVRPLPTWLAAVLFLAYATLVLAGLRWHQLEMFGDVLWRGAPGARGVVLTFDGDLDEARVPALLRLLTEAGARAVFFVPGKSARRHPELARAVRAEGHELGMLGWERTRGYSLRPPGRIVRDIGRCRDALVAATGFRPALLRPPDGQVSTRTAAAARQAGVTLVGWTVDARAGRLPAALRGGCILRLSSDADDAVERLRNVLEALRRQGARIVAIREVASHMPGTEPAPPAATGGD